MKTHLLGLLYLLSTSLHAQVTDNFDDSDLLINPVWSGQINDFKTLKGQLQSNSNAANSFFYISTPSNASVQSEWRIDTKLLFNTSSLNYVDVVVMSDSFDVSRMKNGYFIRLGGATDEISLYRTKAGVESKIIDGADNVLNSSNNQWRIILTREQNSLFTLNRISGISGTAIVEGTVLDSEILISAYLGIRIRQSTASFYNKHVFDNLYAGRIIHDTVGPVLDSLVVMDSKHLLCTFSEELDSSSAIRVNNYTIEHSNIHPITATLLSGTDVLLEFRDGFVPNLKLHLAIDSIGDYFGNYIQKTSKGFLYSRPDTAGFRELLITELMIDPDPVVGLPNNEFIEISNISGKFIQLQGCKIADPTGEKNLPSLVLPPDSILVLSNIPSLNNSEDRIWLSNQRGEILHIVSYTSSWYKDDIKAKGGWSLEMINHQNVCAGAGNWSASIDPRGGTPGKVNSVTGAGPADTKAPVIRGVLPINDSLLQITFDEEIDSLNSLVATLEVNGRMIPLKLHKMASDFISAYFVIDFKQHPDSLYNLILDGIRDCSGNQLRHQRWALQWPSASKRDDLIFNEILFNPKSGGVDFIELYNNSNRTFDLSKHFVAVIDEKNQYKSIDKLTELPLCIMPHQYLLMSADTSLTCESHPCKEMACLKIQNNKMPAMPDDKGNLLLINLSAKTIDSLTYMDDMHFPLLGDKEGVSLERISFTAPTCNVNNWHSAASAAGFATPGYLNSQSTAIGRNNTYFTLQNTTVSPDEDGFEDFLILNYEFPQSDFMTTANIYDVEGRLISQWINNETLGAHGFVTWNGTDYNQQKAGIGVYILLVESTHPDGRKIREKMSFIVAGRF